MSYLSSVKERPRTLETDESGNYMFNLTSEESSKDIERKINSILMEYALRPDNEHMGTGRGGNIQYFGYTQGRESVITSDVADVDFKDNKILWNPDFLLKDKIEIRTRLDDVLAEHIKKENYKFVITQVKEDGKYKMSFDNELVDEKVKASDAEKLLNGETSLPDLTALDSGNKLCLCMMVCAKFADHLDNDPEVKGKYNNFYDLISKFDRGTSLISIRTHITIERLVNHNLDEDSTLGPYFYKIASSF